MEDRTACAVAMQLQAMSCDRYELGLRNTQRGTMLIREWMADDIMHAVPWLKRTNAHDHDIYIRPLGSVGLILGDDLTATTIARLMHDGLSPAVVVETSPRNMQAWLRISALPISEELATSAARIIAERYGADPNSADWRHFGRLAGFTNRKPEHRRDGRQPYVLVHASGGLSCERGAQLLHDAAERLRSALARDTTSAKTAGPISRPPDAPSPAEAYRVIAEPLMAHYGPGMDYSRLDWMVCIRLACGSLLADQAYLEEAMLGGSPGMEQRKLGHTHDYARRTVEKVLRDPEVMAAREHMRQAAAQRKLALNE